MKTNSGQSQQSALQYQHDVDVLVVGSGNGALTAALCIAEMAADKVLVIEKSEKIGGTSAMSGGGIWIPNNRYARSAGANDSLEDAKIYLQQTIPEGLFREPMIDAYLENGPKMLDFLHEKTRVKYLTLEHYPDYYSDLPGSRTGHRSLEPETIMASELGDDFGLLQETAIVVYDRYLMTQVEGQEINQGKQGRRKVLSKLMWDYWTDFPWRFRNKVSQRLTCGIAGIARMLLSLRDRNVPIMTGAALQELIVENNRVVGARIERDGRIETVRARKAVVLAAGGFEQNQAMREKYLPKPTDKSWSAGVRTNTGDAIVAGQKSGAQTFLMDGAWWCSMVDVPDRKYPFLSIVTKSMPGTFVVNKRGQRYANESQNYMSWSKELFRVHDEDNSCVPSYMIFDVNFKKNYNTFPLMGPDFLLPKKFFESGLFTKGKTIKELAEKAGIDSSQLENTTRRFNEFAKTGKDIDFQRGDAAYDRYYGDPKVSPNPCLGPIETPPFYAMRIEAGDFGTHGGLLTNENAQVLDKKSQVIEGLYAVGNCSAAVLPTYPGPGSTLGPAMTFAYQAAKHITGYADKDKK